MPLAWGYCVQGERKMLERLTPKMRSNTVVDCWETQRRTGQTHQKKGKIAIKKKEKTKKGERGKAGRVITDKIDWVRIATEESQEEKNR